MMDQCHGESLDGIQEIMCLGLHMHFLLRLGNSWLVGQLFQEDEQRSIAGESETWE